jgi:hypothetical protein
MASVNEAPLTAAMLLMGPVRGHSMLGCDWGTRVALPDDQALCVRQARRIVVIHDGPDAIDLKVCDEHFAKLGEHTNPAEVA